MLTRQPLCMPGTLYITPKGDAPMVLLLSPQLLSSPPPPPIKYLVCVDGEANPQPLSPHFSTSLDVLLYCEPHLYYTDVVSRCFDSKLFQYLPLTFFFKKLFFLSWLFLKKTKKQKRIYGNMLLHQGHFILKVQGNLLFPYSR